MSAQDEFYVGYLPEAPAGLARWIRWRVIALIGIGIGIGVAFSAAQSDPGPARYEFGEVRSFEGDLRLHPVPHLELARPGTTSGAAGQSRYLLSVFGKCGAGPVVAAYGDRRVRLKGSLVHRAGSSMIELADGAAIEDLGPASDQAAEVDLGIATLRGEIVDTKC
ncbi:MAG: hypothetical protein O2816_18165, partial [Planctomycetota bacterium]|nr:hypothetical protein [Planctomycetota bacterium]